MTRRLILAALLVAALTLAVRGWLTHTIKEL
jgi:hypothetical protein